MAVRYFTLFFLSGTSASVKENTKKGLSEFFSMGQRLISRWSLAPPLSLNELPPLVFPRSSQQVAKMMRKEGKEAVALVSGESDTAVSSSGLIMEARYCWMA